MVEHFRAINDSVCRPVRTASPAKCREGLLITFVSSTHANNHTKTLESGSAECGSSPDKWPGGVRRGDSRKEKHSRPHQHDNHHTPPLNGHDEDQSLNLLVNKKLNNKECRVIYGFKQPLIFSLFCTPTHPPPRSPAACRLPPTKIQRVSTAFIFAIWNINGAAVSRASQRDESVDFHCAIKRMGSGRAVKQDRRQSNKWLRERMWAACLWWGRGSFLLDSVVVPQRIT